MITRSTALRHLSLATINIMSVEAPAAQPKAATSDAVLHNTKAGARWQHRPRAHSARPAAPEVSPGERAAAKAPQIVQAEADRWQALLDDLLVDMRLTGHRNAAQLGADRLRAAQVR